MPDPGGRGCLLRNRDRDRAAVALELEITQDLYARGARVARGARMARGAREPCAEILCIRTEDEKRMIIKCHACAENQGE